MPQGLTFEKPDLTVFKNLALAVYAAKKGGNLACAMNAANEVAVAAFLADKIGFYDIPDTISKVMAAIPYVEQPSLEDIFSTHEEAFRMAKSLFPAL